MRDSKGEVLYVGKAKNVRQRLKNYFVGGGDGRAMIPYLLERVASVDTIVVYSEKEALLLENTLIKEHWPPYNVLLKDDKSFICLRVTTHKKWPTLEVVRSKVSSNEKGEDFGPYPSGAAARETFELLNRLFPLRQCSDRELNARQRPCILYQMKRCLAPCVGFCTKEEYQSHVDRTIKFLKGDDREVLQELKRKMDGFAEELEYEKAQEMLRLIQMLQKTVEGQQVERFDDIHADILGLYREGTEAALAILSYRHGKLVGSQDFFFSRLVQEDEELMESFLMQHRWEINTLLLPLACGAEESLQELLNVKIVIPKKGDKLKLIGLANLNAKAFFVRKKEGLKSQESVLTELQSKLKLHKWPSRIECVDTSHLSGSAPVAAMVAFVEGAKDKSGYRLYKVKEAKGGDDYGAMYEVLTRRFKKAAEIPLPELLLVDGGKGHLAIAERVLRECNIVSVAIAGFAKEAGRHDKGLSAEQIYLPDIKDPIILKRSSPLLFFLQTIRDEAHRFAITFQKKQRSRALTSSTLRNIEGIGPKKEKGILKHFGSVKALKAATREDVERVAGLSKKDVEAVCKFIQK